MRSHALLLQAAEITQIAANAAKDVSAAAKNDGGMASLLWLLVVAFAGAAFFFYWKGDKAITAKNDALINQNAVVKAAVDDAVKSCKEDYGKQLQSVREEYSKQQAFDNGHWEGLLTESRRRETDALDRLERINAELRQQDKKSVEVIGAVGNSMNQVAATMQGMQIKLGTLEMLFTGRSSPPTLPPTVFTPPTP